MHCPANRPSSTLFVFPLSLFLAIALSISSVCGEQLGAGAQLLDLLGEQVNDNVDSKPFELDSLPDDVRVAARGTFDSVADTIRKNDSIQETATKSWELEFTTDIKGEVEHKVEKPRDDWEMVPSLLEYSEAPKALPVCEIATLAMPEGGLPDDLLAEASADEEAPKKRSTKTLPIRPEPDGWMIMLTCLLSLIFVGSCTRILRPLRDNPKGIES